MLAAPAPPAAPAPVPPRSELSELELRRAQAGDEGSFRALVDVYQARVHQLLWRMVEHTLGSGRAEELTQETFTRVYVALPRFQPGGPAALSTWILTIATRLALTELRRARRRPAIPLVGNETSDAPGGDAGVARRQQREAIRAAIAQLDDRYRAVLVLREFHDVSYADIAAMLELDVGTVKSRLSRARANMRAALLAALGQEGIR